MFKVTLQDICAAVLMQYLTYVQGFFLKPFERDELVLNYQKNPPVKKDLVSSIIISVDISYDTFNNELLFVKAGATLILNSC